MKILNTTVIGSIFCTFFLLFSCQTYTIAVDDFRNQMSKAKPENFREVQINNPMPNSYSAITYQANSIESITVKDKNGEDIQLKNSPKLEMRLTHKNGKKYVLLFDTVTLENDTLKGARSRILQNLRREFPMDSIEKIEIQDSKKVYSYQ